MLPVGAILVDFDGTACSHDVAEHLLMEFGDPSWAEYDDAWNRGEIDARQVLEAQASMLEAPLDRLLAYALAHCPIDPTFPPFVRWAEEQGIPVTVVSDGFGFYIAPILAEAGLAHVPVITNTWSVDGATRMRFEHGQGECIWCGTCKMRAVLEARAAGPACFIGEGASDRFGALYADVVFAKDALVEIARSDGVPFLPWVTFDDVRSALESMADVPGPIAPQRCPGWSVPA